MEGLAAAGSGASAGLGQSLGTSAAGSAAGTAAAQTATQSMAGQLGYGFGSALGSGMNQGVAGPVANMFANGGSPQPAQNTQRAQQAASPQNNQGGWFGMGLFGNDQYNPNPSTYAPAQGGQVAQAAMPQPSAVQRPIALAMLDQLPLYSMV